MKKFTVVLTLVLICTLTLCLCSCSNNGAEMPDPKTAKEKVEDLIDAVSNVDSCIEARKAYDALTEEEQSEISNYEKLKEQMKKYKIDYRIFEYRMEKSAAVASKHFHKSLREDLLNINSYTVNKQEAIVYRDNSTNAYYLYINIDYSAQNKAGGYDRYRDNYECYVWVDDGYSSYFHDWIGIWGDISDADLKRDILNKKFIKYTQFDLTYSAE